MNSDALFVVHIIECVENILEYTQTGRGEFEASRKSQDAVIRNFEVMGEATKRISMNLREMHMEIPWKTMAGFRDVLIHDYMGIEIPEVWSAIRELPAILTLLKKILAGFDS